MAGARDPHEVREVKNLAVVLPREDVRESVRTRDEEQVVVRQLRTKVAKRIDRVGLPRSIDIDARNRKARVRSRCDDRHEVTVFGVGNLFARLLPRAPSGDKDHLIKTKNRLDFARGNEVAVMDRIKSPTHHANPALCAHVEGLSGRCRGGSRAQPRRRSSLSRTVPGGDR